MLIGACGFSVSVCPSHGFSAVLRYRYEGASVKRVLAKSSGGMFNSNMRILITTSTSRLHYQPSISILSPLQCRWKPKSPNTMIKWATAMSITFSQRGTQFQLCLQSNPIQSQSNPIQSNPIQSNPIQFNSIHFNSIRKGFLNNS